MHARTQAYLPKEWNPPRAPNTLTDTQTHHKWHDPPPTPEVTECNLYGGVTRLLGDGRRRRQTHSSAVFKDAAKRAAACCRGGWTAGYTRSTHGCQTPWRFACSPLDNWSSIYSPVISSRVPGRWAVHFWSHCRLYVSSLVARRLTSGPAVGNVISGAADSGLGLSGFKDAAGSVQGCGLVSLRFILFYWLQTYLMKQTRWICGRRKWVEKGDGVREHNCGYFQTTLLTSWQGVYRVAWKAIE